MPASAAVAVAIPDAFVTAVAELLPPNVARAPVVGAVNTTTAPDIAAPPASVTLACSALVKFVLITADWLLPAVAAIAAGAAVFDNVNVTVSEPTVAVTVYVPATPFAVNVDAVAIPDALVVTVSLDPPEKLPLAPPTGFTVKVTGRPAMTAPPESLTSTPSRLANAVLMAVDCGVPLAGDATAVTSVASTLVRL